MSSVAAPNVAILAAHAAQFDLNAPRHPSSSLHYFSMDGTEHSQAPIFLHCTTIRRLHVVRRTFPPHPDFCRELAHFSPALMHLCLSCASRDALVLAAAGPMGATGASASDSEHARRTVKTATRLLALRRVVVQPLLMHARSMCGTLCISYGRMQVALAAVPRACAEERGTGTLCMLAAMRHADCFDGIGRGDGAWRAIGFRCDAMN
ncbi:hypothetical protein PsYK624_166300 [Phanerochaete sordida]|uniref:Uncharacterized protein n=1 Tax=Phanerochaete sordida TaxID=48140 RepID=A0A9P3LNA1_9APHY|nr:hypothetical protein PsYK624_166300 [Phanerochaete sordida]